MRPISKLVGIAAIASCALAAPASATVLYHLTDPGFDATFHTSDFLTSNTTGALDTCSVANCTNYSFHLTGPVVDLIFENATSSAEYFDFQYAPVSDLDADGTFTGFRSGTLTISEGAQGVPEPSTWAMLILGLLGIGAAARMGRKRSSATA